MSSSFPLEISKPVNIDYSVSQKGTGGDTAFVAGCTLAAFLDNCFTELVFCGLTCFAFGLPTLSTPWKEMAILEKEGDLPVFHIDNLNKKNLPTAGVITQLG